MRTKWVLAGFGIAYLLFALSFLPSERVLTGAAEEVWETIRGVLWGGMTVISIGLLEAMGLVTKPLGRSAGLGAIRAEEMLLAAICLAVAAFSVVRWMRADAERGGIYLFLILLSLSVVAMVRFTLYSWEHFA